MVSDALAAGTHEADAAGATDRRAAAFVLVIRGDVADPGMQAHRVVLDANELKLGPEDGRVGDRVEVWPVGLDVAEQALYSPNQRGFGSCYLWLPRAANGRATLICVNARAGPPDPGRPNLSPPPDTRSAFSEQVSCPEQQQRR